MLFLSSCFYSVYVCEVLLTQNELEPGMEWNGTGGNEEKTIAFVFAIYRCRIFSSQSLLFIYDFIYIVYSSE